ncbi:MAG: hypothetical protein AAF662_10395 [Pseudomonadota bacterium]
MEAFKTELLEAVKGNRELQRRVDELLGEGATAPSRISNWRKRSAPDAFAVGGAIAKFMRPSDDDQLDGIPPDLAKHYGDTVTRVGLWSEAIWHVFHVAPNQTSEHLDVRIWRYWQGIHNTAGIPKRLSHATMADGDAGGFVSIGSPVAKFSQVPESIAVSSRPNAGDVQVQCNIGTELVDAGYMLNAKSALCSRSTETDIYEFLGGSNVIPCRKSYVIANIPKDAVSGSFFSTTRAISFAPQSAPTDYVHNLLASEGENRRVGVRELLEPWGETSVVEERFKDPMFPAPLLESVREYWSNVPLPDTGHRLFSASFYYPNPLTYQTLIYKLPI